MSLIAEFSVSSSRLVLHEATTSVPAVELDLMSEVATDPERPMLDFWVEGSNLDDFEAAMEADETVSDPVCYTEMDARRLYRIQISEAVDLVIYSTWVKEGGSRLETTCQDGVWHNRFRFPDRESFQRVYEWCVDHDIEFTLHRLYRETDDDSMQAETDLTPEQEETLRRAYELGYHEIPQQTTLVEIASELGISQQAVSERLRRGYGTLIKNHVADGDE